MASNLMASDLLDIDWGRRARDILEKGRRAEAERLVREAYAMRAPELHLPWASEPVEIREKNFITDPNSWLNKGLNRLVGDASAVILGEPSGNNVVDLGVANVPGVGAGAILAAGGVPGIIDVIPGAAELKNISKIPKYTLEFVGKHFGERGLKNLDNALTKFPKAQKPSVNDAIYIMKSGMGGEQVPAIVPYSSNDMFGDIADMLGMGREKFDEMMDMGYRNIAEANGGIFKADLDKAVAEMNKAAERNDLGLTNAYASLIMGSMMGPEEMAATVSAFHSPGLVKKRAGSFNKFYQYNRGEGGTAYDDKLRLMKELYESPTQDWEKIALAQERKDVKDAEKALKKATKQNTPEAPKQAPAAPVEKPVQAPVVPVEKPVAPVELPKVELVPEVSNVPGWTKNWKSTQYSPNFYERFGSRLDENSKRDMFVVDSLKNHWVSQLGDPDNRGFSVAEIINGLQRADARHNKTNYNKVSRAFTEDIRKNIESGNMPGTAVKFKQAFKNNTPIEGKETPTLLLRLDEKPRVYMDSRVWADEAEGPDLYELLFRPAVDRKLNSLNPRYWEY